MSIDSQEEVLSSVLTVFSKSEHIINVETHCKFDPYNQQNLEEHPIVRKNRNVCAVKPIHVKTDRTGLLSLIEIIFQHNTEY